MYIHVRVRMPGGSAEDFYGSFLTKANVSPLRTLIIRDQGRVLRRLKWKEWLSYEVSKTEDVPTTIYPSLP